MQKSIKVNGTAGHDVACIYRQTKHATYVVSEHNNTILMAPGCHLKTSLSIMKGRCFVSLS